MEIKKIASVKIKAEVPTKEIKTDELCVLHDVVDTRTEQYHSEAIVKEKNMKWFIPAEV